MEPRSVDEIFPNRSPLRALLEFWIQLERQMGLNYACFHC